jgi:hypothetical protein
MAGGVNPFGFSMGVLPAPRAPRQPKDLPPAPFGFAPPPSKMQQTLAILNEYNPLPAFERLLKSPMALGGPISERDIADGLTVAGTVTGGSAAAPKPRNALNMGIGMPFGMEISTRFPTAVKKDVDPLNAMLLSDYPSFQQSTVAPHNSALVGQTPGLRIPKDATPEQQAQLYIDQSADNLQFLKSLPSGDESRRMSMWYDGANKITKQMAGKYGLPDSSVAGVFAALSPQKDWFQNVSLGERVMDIVHMFGKTPLSTDAISKAPPALLKPQFSDMLTSIAGKPLASITDPVERALWVRLFDEANMDRGYRSILPEGDFGEFVTTKAGGNAKVAWGSLNEIAKAIGAIDANGDINKISTLMGEKNKVRNFYNNIVAPNSPLGHVTADTHAVAANQMRPLSGNTPEVAQNFGNALDKKFWPESGFVAAKGSAKDGVQGTYSLNAEPYRVAASREGLLPRQMQSVGWEVVRSIFPDTFKTAANAAKVDNIWKNYEKGVISIDDARSQILSLSGGYRTPDWFRHDRAVHGTEGHSSYKGKLP